MGLGAILGAASVFLLGLVGRRLLGDAGGLLAAGQLALYDLMIVHDTVPLSEGVVVFLVIALLAAFGRFVDRPERNPALLYGTVAGLLTLAKPNLLVLAVLVPLGPLLEKGCEPYPLPGRALGQAAAACVLVLLPFLGLARAATGEWVFLRTHGAYYLLVGNHPAASGGNTDPEGEYAALLAERTGAGPGKYGRHEAASLELVVRFWREQPAAALGLLAVKTRMFLSPVEKPNNVNILYYRQVSFLGSDRTPSGFAYCRERSSASSRTMPGPTGAPHSARRASQPGQRF